MLTVLVWVLVDEEQPDAHAANPRTTANNAVLPIMIASSAQVVCHRIPLPEESESHSYLTESAIFLSSEREVSPMRVNCIPDFDQLSTVADFLGLLTAGA